MLFETSAAIPGGSGSGVTWSEELDLFVLVGYNSVENTGPGTAQTVATSPDGLVWTSRDDPFSTPLNDPAVTGSVEPDWGSIVQPQVVIDGDYYVQRNDQAWEWLPLTAPGDLKLIVRAGYAYRTGFGEVGSTGASEPVWGADPVTDGSVTWHRLGPAYTWAATTTFDVGDGAIVIPSGVGDPLDIFFFGRAIQNAFGQAVCWSPDLGLFVMVGGNFFGSTHVATSPDGSTWTPHGTIFTNDTLVGPGYANGVCWSPELELFVAVGFSCDYADAVATSPDGATWTTHGNPFGGSFGSGTGVCWSPELGLFVASGQSGTYGIITSSDGVLWDGQTDPISTDFGSGAILAVAWSPDAGVFVAGGSNSDSSVTAMSSPDGEVWTPQGNTINNQVYGVTWSAALGVFLIVGYGDNQVASSADGAIWVGVGSPFFNGQPYGVCASTVEGGRFLLAGSTGDSSVQAARGPEDFPPTADAATLFGALGLSLGTSDLYTIDTDTGAATAVGPIGYAVTGLAIDPTDMTLYGVTSINSVLNPNSLIVINPLTGTGILVGYLGGQEFSDITFNSDGDLFGWGSSGSGLISIDKASCVTTVIGTDLGDSQGGLSFDSNDVLFFADVDNDFLYTIDPLDGAGTAVVSLTGYSPDGSAVINALAFGVSDVLYAADSGDADFVDLIRIDTLSGFKVLVGATENGMDAVAHFPTSAPAPPPFTTGRFVWGGISTELDGDTYKSTMTSDDGGETWVAVVSQLDNRTVDVPTEGATGLTRIANLVVAVGSNDPSHAEGMAGVVESVDQGDTWVQADGDPSFGDLTPVSNVFSAEFISKIVVVGSPVASGPAIVVGALDDVSFTWSPKSSIFDGYWARCGAYSQGLDRMVVVGQLAPSGNAAYSDDGGDTWTVCAGGSTIGSEGTNDLWTVIWIEELGVFVASGEETVATSTDGITWVDRGFNADGVVICLGWSDEQGILVGGLNGQSGPSGVLVTDNPEQDVSLWSRYGTPLWGAGGVGAVAYGGGRWVITGQAGVSSVDSTATGGCVATSPDAHAWTLRTTPYDGLDVQAPLGESLLFIPDESITSMPTGVCFAPHNRTLTVNPTWVRLDDSEGYRLASGWSISRGRTGEMDKTGTGTASVSLFDLGGVIDPTSGGPFVGELDPMKQASIALQNPVTEEWSTLFRGFIQKMDHELMMFDNDRGIDTVTMELVDAFDLLAAMELTPSVHGHPVDASDFADVYYAGTPANFDGPPAQEDVFVHVDDRFVKILDDAGWPNTGMKRVGLRNIFSGNVSVQGVVYSRRDQILQALFDCADAEFPGVANIFVSKNGVITFHGRYARFFPERPGYAINSWKVGSLYEASLDEELAPIVGMNFRRSSEDIINACIATPQHIGETLVPDQLVKDNTSIATYGWRSVSFDNLLLHHGHDDDSNPVEGIDEAKKFADYYVGNYSVPRTRVTSIKFKTRGVDTVGGPALWALFCGVEIGDVVRLKTQHPGDGGFDEDFFVEGIRYEAAPMRQDIHDITMELEVSPRSFYAYNPFGEFDDTDE